LGTVTRAHGALERVLTRYSSGRQEGAGVFCGRLAPSFPHKSNEIPSARIHCCCSDNPVIGSVNDPFQAAKAKKDAAGDAADGTAADEAAAVRVRTCEFVRICVCAFVCAFMCAHLCARACVRVLLHRRARSGILRRRRTLSTRMGHSEYSHGVL
jgi:hypothetical protein